MKQVEPRTATLMNKRTNVTGLRKTKWLLKQLGSVMPKITTYFHISGICTRLLLNLNPFFYNIFSFQGIHGRVFARDLVHQA